MIYRSSSERALSNDDNDDDNDDDDDDDDDDCLMMMMSAVRKLTEPFHLHVYVRTVRTVCLVTVKGTYSVPRWIP